MASLITNTWLPNVITSDAIYTKGMSVKRQLFDWIDAISGEVLNHPYENIVDKHSTGGIGDKTSFIIAPIAAAAGVYVPWLREEVWDIQVKQLINLTR